MTLSHGLTYRSHLEVDFEVEGSADRRPPPPMIDAGHSFGDGLLELPEPNDGDAGGNAGTLLSWPVTESVLEWLFDRTDHQTPPDSLRFWSRASSGKSVTMEMYIHRLDVYSSVCMCSDSCWKCALDLGKALQSAL